MIFNTITEKNESFFQGFAKLGNSINDEQLLSRIYLIGYNAEDVDDMQDELRSLLAQFRSVNRHMQKEAATFLDRYGTDDNDCYANAGKHLFGIHRLLKQELKVFNLYCVNNQIKRPFREGLSLWDMRRLDFRSEFEQQLLPFVAEGISSSNLKNLTDLINSLCWLFIDCILLCIKMLQGEMKIRKDYPRIRDIYDKTMRQIACKVTAMMGNCIKCPDSIEDIEDSMTRDLLQAKNDSWNEILAKYYHKRTPEELLFHYLMFTAFKSKLGSFSPREMKLWNNDADKIKKVKLMISYFDELEPKGQKDKSTGNIKLSGEWMAKLTEWAIRGYNIDKKDFVDYFNNEYKGKYQRIGYASVMAAYNILMKKDGMDYIIKFENFLNEKKKEEKKKIA